MNKRARIAIYGIVLSVIIAIIFILPFMVKAQAGISYNNNLASTPSEIKQKIPLTVEKDSNWQVEWHETYAGLTHREYVIAIQNQKETSNNFALSVIFNELNFPASQVSNVNILEWKKVSKERPIYETIEKCEYPPVINNATGQVTGNSTRCWSEQEFTGTKTYQTYEWIRVKDTAIEQETSDVKQEAYDSVVFDGKSGKEENNIRYFKLGFDVPILKLSDGSFGSQGRVAFIEGNSGKEYHPVWMSNYTYYYNGSVNTSSNITLTNIIHRINGSAGWYNNIIWCNNPNVPNATLNGTYTFYENSNTDYRYVNASDNKELPCETEKGNAMNRSNGTGSLFDTSVVKGMYFMTSAMMDSSGNGNHWTTTAQVVQGGNSPLGLGGYLNFSEHAVGGMAQTTSDVFNPTTELEVCMWFALYGDADTTGDNICPIIKDTLGDGSKFGMNMLYQYVAGVIRNRANGNDIDTKTNFSNFPEGTWFYYCYSANNGVLSIYVNGILDTSGSYTSPIPNSGTAWSMGRDAGNGRQCNMSVDNLKIRFSASSAQKIKAEYELEKYEYTMLGARQPTTGIPWIRDISISPATAYTNSILNCSGTYYSVSDGKADITWYNDSAFYGITSKVGMTNGSMASSAPEAILDKQDGFSTQAFGSDFPMAITTNGSDFWIDDYSDGFVYHVNRTGGNMSDGFSTTTFGAGTTVQGITTNGTDFWITDSTDNFTYHTNKSGYNFTNGFRIGSYILGITTNGSDFWVVDGDGAKVYHTKPNGVGGATNYSDSFSTTGFGSQDPYDIEVRGSDLWIYDLSDKFVYHVKPDGAGGAVNYSDGFSVADISEARAAITSFPVSYDNSNLSSITDFWITSTNLDSVTHKKRVVADVAKGETWNCTILATNSQGMAGAPNSTTRTISNSPPIIGPVDISGFNNCSAIAYDLDLESLTLNFTWYNGSVYYSNSTKSSSNGTLASYSLPEGTQKGGETWNCSVSANDGTDNSALNSSSVIVGYNITFDVRDGETNLSLPPTFNIYCDDSWQVTGVSSPYSRVFSQGSYECTFVKANYFNETKAFVADCDKTVYVTVSLAGKMTTEEHNWLEWLYNCWKNGDCRALLENINQTTTQIWQQVTRTNRDVVTQETFVSDTLSSSSNITIDYTVQIPFKQGYSNGELLPFRMYFWFTDEAKTTCYNQDKRDGGQNRAENLYCFPLIAETLGPNNGSVNFTVDLRPNLTEGTYNVVRAIEIDPIFGGEQTWTNYGQESIGQVKVENGNYNPSINIDKTGETLPPKTGFLTGTAIKDLVNLFSDKDRAFLLIFTTIVCITVIIHSYLKYGKNTAAYNLKTHYHSAY
jgi:hypothetical protein